MAQLKDEVDQEVHRRLLPGYVRRFVQRAVPLLDLRIEGDLDTTFHLVPTRPRALDPLLPALEGYSEESRDRLTVYRSGHGGGSVWMHPGEPLFDRLSASMLGRFRPEGLKGSAFIDPNAAEPYLFHIALVTVEQMEYPHGNEGTASPDRAPRIRPRESSLVGLLQTADGSIEERPVEHLLLLKGVSNFAPGGEPLAAMARDLVAEAERYAEETVTGRLVEKHRQRLLENLDSRLEFVARGFGYQAADLALARTRLSARAQGGDPQVVGELARVRERQRALAAIRERRLDSMRAEPDGIVPGDVEFLVHALIVPSQEPEEVARYGAEVESIAVSVAIAYEEGFNAEVKDVSRPELARRAGLPDWPGFDLLSRRPANAHSPAEERDIEVKGRAGYGGVELQDNEWAKALQPEGAVLALRRLRLRHAPPAPGTGLRSLRQAACQTPRVNVVHHLPEGVG